MGGGTLLDPLFVFFFFFFSCFLSFFFHFSLISEVLEKRCTLCNPFAVRGDCGGTQKRPENSDDEAQTLRKCLEPLKNDTKNQRRGPWTSLRKDLCRKRGLTPRNRSTGPLLPDNFYSLFFSRFWQAQGGPGRPREVQGAPGSSREARGGPGRPREIALQAVDPEWRQV